MPERKGKWFMLRVTDRQRDREDRYKNELMKKVETYACAEEPHESEDTNYHYHSIHMKQKTTLHERCVKLGWTGNENKAFSHLIEDTDEHWRRCLCYISKGPKHGIYPKIIINDFKFTEEQIWEFHNEWWNKWYKMKFKEIKKEKPNFTKQVILEFEEKYIKTETIEYDEIEDKYDVLQEARDVRARRLYEFVESKFCLEFKPFNIKLVTDICRTIWLRNPAHFSISISKNLQREQFVEKMCLQIFSIRQL